jgi:hypothetical protein
LMTSFLARVVQRPLVESRQNPCCQRPTDRHQPYLRYTRSLRLNENV